MGDRLEAADPALVNQTHEKGFHGIVIVVAQGKLMKALIHQRLIQRAPAHFGAHRAGVLFLPIVEDNGADLRFHNGIGHIQFFAQLRDFRIIHAKAHIDGDCLQLEILIMIAPQRRQKLQKHQRILSSGDAYGDFISVFDHGIVFHAPANQADKFLHF